MANHGCCECAQRICPAHAGLSLGEEDAPRGQRLVRAPIAGKATVPIGSHQQRDSPFGGAPKSTRKARVLPEFGQRESLDSERITFTMFNL